jgi:hypothetical protein
MMQHCLGLVGRRGWSWFFGTISLAFWSESTALARDDVEAARALFLEARQLVTEGQYERACPQFEKSLKLESGIGTQFNLADCWEHIGRTASAYNLFRAAAIASKEKGQPDRERVAAERAEALLPQLSKLQVKRDAAVTGLRVSRDDVVITNLSFREPTPVDPGLYTVVSVSGDKELWTTQVNVPPRALTVLVNVPPQNSPTNSSGGTEKTASEAPTAPKSLVLPPSETRTSERLPALPEKSTDDATAIWPAAALLAGGAGAAIGTVFALIYQSKNNQARDICPQNVGCSDSDIQTHAALVSDAKTARLGAFISFGLGAASAAAATIYYATRSSNREKPPTAAFDVSPMLGGGNGGFWGAAARGSW